MSATAIARPTLGGIRRTRRGFAAFRGVQGFRRVTQAVVALPADTPPSTALKDLEGEVFTVSALRTWLASGSAPAP